MFRFCALLLLSAMWAAAQPANLLILHKGGSSLGFYTAEGKHVVSVPVGTHPHEMVISMDRRYLYCTDNGTMLIEQKAEGGNTLSIVDLQRRVKVGEISLGQYRRPHGIDLDRQSGLIYVSCELPDQLLVVSPKVGRVVKTYDTKGTTAHMVKLGPRSRYAYVSNSTSDTVAAIELASGAVKLIPTGKRPEGSALAPDGRLLYVVNREAAQIVIIDTMTNELVGTIKTGKGPVRVAVTPDSKQIVYGLMHDNAVGIADAAKRVEIATVPLPGSPVSLSVSEDGRFALASAQDLDTTYIVSLADRKIAREVRTAEGTKPDPAILLP